MPATNRLAHETSPYLLQHATNPVAWWPWCDEAFSEARRLDVPVLISVGYSACHWCHVMAHESFEDGQVADVINSGFVAIKVDREERPDIDAVYMEAVQLVTGSGGWPMTVLATPEGKPFWGGTYLPKTNFLKLLNQISGIWSSQRKSVEEDADRLVEAVREGSVLPAAKPPSVLLGSAGESQGQDAHGPDALARTAAALISRQDPEWGGTGGAPKFPQPTTLEAFAQYWWRSGDAGARDSLLRSLDAMSSGGIYDHLGGGFARYSTDRRWLVPHFEKMLYDNALLTRAYTHAWQLTGSPRYQQVVEETVGYLLSEPLRLAEGAWASAEDADSEGHEGKFYTWSWDELVAVGGRETAAWYGASPEGNWEGTNILWRPGLADILRPPEIGQARSALLDRRNLRARPGLDAKVLAEWNAMAVSALALAGTAMGRPEWVEAASQTAELLVDKLRRPDGRWLRSWRAPMAGAAMSGPGPSGPDSQAGGTKPLACAADYAWLVEGFTRLAEATGKARWAELARQTAGSLLELFWDDKEGGFFTYGHDGEGLIARMKDVFDGAVPSANAAAAQALARLGELTGEARYLDAAARTVALMAPAVEQAPGAFAGIAAVADYLAGTRRQVVVASSRPELVQAVWARYLPDTVLAWGEPYPSALWQGRQGPDVDGLAFVCEAYTCKLPVRSAPELVALLDHPPAAG